MAASSVPLNYIGPIVTAVLLFFMAAACIGLWWNARNLRAFRTVGLYLLSVSSVFFIAFLREPLSWQSTLLILTSLLMPEMTADALGIRRGWWIWVNRIACALALLLAWSPLLPLLYRSTVDLSELLVFVLIVIGLRRGNARERLIAAALTVLWFTRAPLDPFVRRYIPMGFRVGGWRWNFGPIAMVLFGSVAIATFVRELIEDQQEKQRLAAEFEAGRAMQQVLLGAKLPSFPSLRIDSVYMPAGEVGGDFFHVLPAPDTGVLIAVGDVSGKGLRAAMTVSAILGALRALPVAPPAELLHALNRTLIGRLQGGLVTCCMAQIAPGGTTTIANAGHLAPYLGGEELSLESGLPLGVTADVRYPESTFVLAPGDTLTFVSDGVIEAQSAGGELYGFDRTRQISQRSAQEIAQAAQEFGQHDDITVLTVTFASAEVPHA
ncbi:MAG TPA: PP2C family protein-serine/threonine phosphatase [Acidobacteriaceae bacterium]|nr:PP2C family protein-serine/threonine phosphatase [Acidobacteriaceae bacterium]